MREMANFIGELGGESWNTQAVAAMLVGTLALSAAVITAVVTARQGRLNRLHAARIDAAGRLEERKLKGRQDWWTQFTWAAESLYTSEHGSPEVAASVLNRLEQVPWATPEERDLVTEVLESLNSNISFEDIQEVRRAQDHAN